MEATVLSIGKVVLVGALGFVKSTAAEEFALQLGVKRDVVFIADELEMMQSFLMTADEEQDKHKLFLTWVKQVREVAYNVEDSLMDFSLRSRNCCLWCSPRALLDRRHIANEVKELKAKVEDVSNRNLRYRLVKGSDSKTFISEVEHASAAGVEMFGINNEKRITTEQEHSNLDLCQLIIGEDKGLRVIAVWGSNGDHGKTSAIREAYEHQMVQEKFGCRGWVKLTEAFNPYDFFHNLLRQFSVYSRGVAGKQITQGQVAGYDVLKEFEKMEQSHVADRVLAYVDKQRYLVVIDGLSTIVDWDWIKTYFPDRSNGSRIIVSTQQVEVASLCTEQPYQVTKLKQFSDQSIHLFHKKVVPRSVNTSSDSNNLEVPSSSRSEIQEGTALKMAMGGAKRESKLDRSKTMVGTTEVLVGRMNEKDEIIKLVGSADKSHSSKVISVWGMGGLGKTTIVRSVYQSQHLGGWKRAWVTALRPFSAESTIRSLVLQLQEIQPCFEDDLLEPDGRNVLRSGPFITKRKHFWDWDGGRTKKQNDAGSKEKEKKTPISAMGLQELSTEITGILEKHKCLIVVDDLLSIEEWDSIKGILAKAGRVIVTTREKYVAKYCSREVENMYNLQGLDDGAAFELFTKKVFKDNTEKVELDPGMKEEARLIIKRCDGLPLAISTIGGFLATKPKTVSEWRMTYDRINTELEINPELRTIKTVLVRSYDGLPYHLKSCFLYMSIFPEDYKIRRKRLVKRWVAEGYAREMHGMTAEEVGDMYFDELLDRSMILPGEDVNNCSAKINSCQLHDIMRQICISKAREENLSFTLEKNTSSIPQGAIRHLAISSNWGRDKDVFQSILDLSRLRSLTVFGEWRSFFISSKMRFLRVLDLEGTSKLYNHHLEQIGEFIHLKYISVRGCQNVSHLPICLGNLANLQTLDAKGVEIFNLPNTITNLQKLQYLHAIRFSHPRGIERLNNLHSLGSVNLGDGNDHLSSLKELFQVRKLGVYGVSVTNNWQFWSTVASLDQWQSLRVNWDRNDKIELDSSLGNSLLPPRSIKSLKLGGRLVKLTEWMLPLQNLTRLQLLGAELRQDAMQAIGKLQNLSILHMWENSFCGDELLFIPQSFLSLILLVFHDRHSIRFIRFEDGAMPNLDQLRLCGLKTGLRRKPGLRYFPELKENQLNELSGLIYLTKLKEIQLGTGFSKELKKNVRQQLKDHPNSASLKLL